MSGITSSGTVLKHAFVGDNSQAQAINIYDTNGKILIKIINVYVTDNMLDFSQLYELADGYPSLLMGDLNAYHYKLEDNASGRSNNNRKKLVSYMENNQDVLNILNGPEPTHLQGNKLDYICLINDPALSHHCEVVDTLTSDHFGVYGEIFLPDTVRRHSMPRKRLCVPKKHEQRIREQMNNWYKHYTA
ncbi:hypothetical protein GWK47_015797 [Chionoecetes opilio]|uniref:Endonuclease/exonuclease/phosphatase domain-containing protein n=1 Tax=Chionoecetes opilio TaxID=41210 RepID=A0A8J5CJZ1_CHIOP|nr:hypothetical protein GWK47_015797 [Chionoecetes opilio]